MPILKSSKVLEMESSHRPRQLAGVVLTELDEKTTKPRIRLTNLKVDY